ncbi:MAG: hypothetical protein ACI93N_000967 [Flavobacteriaceae bacterium]|jgi:hypothetical protein|tara:strand:- start:191 stop:1531 length:1341 start_codon:yes stop_codon:yes gene_type:complete
MTFFRKWFELLRPFLKRVNIVLLFLFLLEVLILLTLRVQLALNEAALTNGDQLYYLNEVKKLSELGFYAVLSEGTSIVYSYIVLFFSYCFETNYLIVGKLINFGFIIITALVFYFIMRKVFKIGPLFSIFIALFYVYSFDHYSYKMLSDVINNFFLASGFFLFYISFKNTYKRNYTIILSAVLFGLSTSCRPTSFIFVIAFALSIILIDKIPWKIKGSFLMVVTIIFLLFQIPSLIEKKTISIENKNTVWIGDVKVNKAVSWENINAYFVLFPEVHKQTSKFKIDKEDVIEYIEKNPGILPQSSFQLLLSYPKVWFKHFRINWNTVNRVYFSVFGFHLIWSNLFFSLLLSCLLMPFLLIYFLKNHRREPIAISGSFFMISIYTAFFFFAQYALVEENWLLIVLPFFLGLVYLKLKKYKLSLICTTGILFLNCISCFLTIRYVWSLI